MNGGRKLSDATPYLNQIVNGEVRQVLRNFPDDSVDLVITSPPYWGLRDYGDETRILWGGNNCEHDFSVEGPATSTHDFGGERLRWQHKVNPTPAIQTNVKVKHGDFCCKCGAWCGSLGLEPDYKMYVAHLLEIISEVKRVLKPTGSFYLNIADTYNGTGAHTENNRQSLGKHFLMKEGDNSSLLRPPKNDRSLPSKSLIGLPERIMLGMMDQGWAIESKIIWHKPSHMPESMKGRYTRSWEYLYYCTKNTTKTLLWRNRMTKEWVSKRPAEQKWLEDGQVEDEYRWECLNCDAKGSDHKSRLSHTRETKKEHRTWGRPLLWQGFDSYFELDNIRIPNTVVGVTDKRPNGILRQKLYQGSQERYASAGDNHLQQYLGKFSGFGNEAEKYGSPRARSERLAKSPRKEDVFPGADHNPQPNDRAHFGIGSVISDRYKDSEVRGNIKGKNPGDVWKMAQLPNAGTLSKYGHSGYYDKDGKLLVNPLGKNPGDIIEVNSLDELKASRKALHIGSLVEYKGELYEVIRPNSLHQPKSNGRDVRFSIQANYDDLPVMRKLKGKNPGDVVEIPDTTKTERGKAKDFMGDGIHRKIGQKYQAYLNAIRQGKNPGDILTLDDTRSKYKRGNEPNTSYLAQKRLLRSGPFAPGAFRENNPLGKNPSDIIEASPETRSLGAIIGEAGAVKVPGGQGWIGHPEGGMAKIVRDNDPRWLPREGKNPGNFWSINPEPFKGKHFASYPLGLCWRPIAASCPPDGIVLDIFGGTGTTAEAVEILNITGKIPDKGIVKRLRKQRSVPLEKAADRKWILIEIKKDYCEMAKKRLSPYGDFPIRSFQ